MAGRDSRIVNKRLCVFFRGVVSLSQDPVLLAANSDVRLGIISFSFSAR